MLKGFYSAASGMIAQQRRTEMLTNNIANANTPGFKADQSSLRAFPEMLLQRMEAVNIPTKNGNRMSTMTTIGGINTGVYMQEAIPMFKQGDLQETGINTDIALIEGFLPINGETNQRGALFFTVQNEAGEIRYTRNGNFAIDSEGHLTTNEGYYVLDQNGNRVQLQSENFQVGQDGTIIENGGALTRLNIAYAENPNELMKEGNGLFFSNNELPSAIGNEEISYSLNQGFIERSNVDVAQTMTEMMTAYRAFEANQKILQAYDKSLEKAVNEIGRIR